MISELAHIHPSAYIAADVTIGPWTVIGENVVIDAGNKISSHVVIDRNTKIGKNNNIFSHVILGSAPQHLGYKGEDTHLEIADKNIIREFVTINRGTPELGLTKIGSNNYIMSYAHIAHDCEVGNHVIFANTASIAGHVKIGDYAILGAFSGVHQYVKIGAFSFLGRATKILQDVLPFMLVTGNPGIPKALNLVGLRRNGFSAEEIQLLKEAFVIIFRKSLKYNEVVAKLEKLAVKSKHIGLLLDAMQISKRGIARKNVVEM